MLRALLIVSTLLSANAAMAGRGKGPVTGPQAKSHLTKRLQYSSKVFDKTRPFKTSLGGQKGDKLRPFTADNTRHVILPGPAPAGALGGMRVQFGNRVEGVLNMETGTVRTTAVMRAR